MCKNEKQEFLTESNTGIVTLLRRYDELAHPGEKNAVEAAKAAISQVVIMYHSAAQKWRE